MTLAELKLAIEKRTCYTFVEGEDVLGREVLFLKGIPKKREITVGLSSGRFPVSVSGADRLKSENNPCGYRGFGCPCNTVDEAIRRLDCHAVDYGFVSKPKQMNLFEVEE